MNVFKRILLIALSSMFLFCTAACRDGESAPPPSDKITYTAYKNSTIEFQDNSDSSLSNYDSSQYYLNEWENFDRGEGFPDMGDPMIVYDDGYYYAFGTRVATLFQCFRSTDFSVWEKMPDAFVPQIGSWSTADLWAPDIQKIGDKWYLYYTARFVSPDSSVNPQIGVAVSDNVYGPYIQFTGKNAHQENITLANTPFTGLSKHTVLDQNVFVDGDDMYMYFSYDTTTGSSQMRDLAKDDNCAEIWGVKMIDAVTWDLSTLKPLISPGYKTMESPRRTIAWETWSPSFQNGFECAEGPYMIKKNGKYFLTYCANSFVDTEYAVGYAISDSPLGDFTKPDGKYLENMLLGVPGQTGSYINDKYLGFTTGTGHAAIFETGDGKDYMFAYHAHYNRDRWNDNEPRGNYRSLSVDYLYFDESDMPYTNGPTYSLTRTPGDVSGYSNIASSATIKAEGTDAKYLNDNYTNRAIKTEEIAKEANFNKGTRSIEIKFDKKRTVKAINIFNSYDFEKMIDSIDQIDFGDNRGVVNALFNQRYVDYDGKFVFPHSAFNIELKDELMTDRIVITITGDKAFALGEIEIIGK